MSFGKALLLLSSPHASRLKSRGRVRVASRGRRTRAPSLVADIRLPLPPWRARATQHAAQLRAVELCMARHRHSPRLLVANKEVVVDHAIAVGLVEDGKGFAIVVVVAVEEAIDDARVISD